MIQMVGIDKVILITVGVKKKLPERNLNGVYFSQHVSILKNILKSESGGINQNENNH